MNSLLEYIKKSIIVADGACGTFISSFIGRLAAPCETLNITDPQTVLRMHKQYVESGAKLILTNTFAASSAGDSLTKSFDKTKLILKNGVALAKEAAAENAFVAADIGPLPETSVDSDKLEIEYKRIADAFIEEGVKNFCFETFSDSKYPIFLSRYIKEKVPDAFIIISFSVMPDGISREGISGQQLVDEVAASGFADACGFNCTSGPAHLLGFAKTVDFKGLFPSIMPNAGYPRRENDDISYSGSPEYFADILSEAANAGFRIIGGCCGTTPRHIKKLAEKLNGAAVSTKSCEKAKQKKSPSQKQTNTFEEALKGKRKTVVVELEPPFDTDTTKLFKSAQTLKAIGVDALTVADSPMARARADSVAIAALLKRKFDVEVIPHLCCRDKNINAIKSSLIAAHIEGVRNILAITGDPVSDTDRGLVKSVFNLNSEGLLRFIKSLNDDVFSGDPMLCGCAFNANAKNTEIELNRLEKKIVAGAKFALTQPVMTEKAVLAVKKANELSIKMLSGIITPVTYKNAVFLANEMPGFSMPEEYLARFNKDMTREEGEKVGIEISIECAKKVAPFVSGFYFVVPFNRSYVTAKIIESLRKENII